MKKALLGLIVAILLVSCASSPSSRFYTLNPISPPATRQAAASGGNGVSIVVLPVEIPDYLDRPHMVTRDGQNELKLAQYDRWAGSLSDNMSAVLAENLATLLNTNDVSLDPGRDGKADYSVAMRVLRLDCLPGSQVLLKAQWTVFSGDDEEVASDICSLTETMNDSRYDTMAAAVSKTLAQMSRDIAQRISRQ